MWRFLLPSLVLLLSQRRAPYGTTSAFAAPGGTSAPPPVVVGGALDSSTARKKRTVLVTGGCGYIGSHTCVELLSTGRYRVVVVDNLDNSSTQSLDRVRELTSLSSDDDALHFRHVDVRDRESVRRVLEEFSDISSCIHFAGRKAVGESVEKPLDYYQTNVAGTCTLLECLKEKHIKHFVFSSSATVYGEPEILPLPETARLSATNPYGRTKLFVEEILRDAHAADPELWNILILRYFNPIGAHPSGRIGEDPRGIPNNLMPFVAQVCVGRRERLSVFGDDYDTPDGTGVRDYIHVVDLARGHVAALQKLYADTVYACSAVNLGTGTGISVLDLVRGMEQATGQPVPYVMAPRRPGDVASLYADPGTAARELGWTANLGLTDMCEDTWRWQSRNPYGYTTTTEEEEEEVVAEN